MIETLNIALFTATLLLSIAVSLVTAQSMLQQGDLLRMTSSIEIWVTQCKYDVLQELTLAGNTLTELPEGIGNLTQLQKLQVSGNMLQRLPDSIGNLSRLEVCLHRSAHSFASSFPAGCWSRGLHTHA